MMMLPFRGPDPGRVLARGLLAWLPAGTVLLDQTRTPWASATFVGTQHHLRLTCPDHAALAAFVDRIRHAEFALRGHLLADITAEVVGESLLVEALTLVEA